MRCNKDLENGWFDVSIILFYFPIDLGLLDLRDVLSTITQIPSITDLGYMVSSVVY